jgi:hypothetical protein
MKYEEPLMNVIELVTREVFMTGSPGGTIGSQTGGGGGVFEDDDDGVDF